MNETKHTQGEWKIRLSGGYIVDESERKIADLLKSSHPSIKGEEMYANAKLIAAAPELLEALESLLEHVRYVGLDNYYQVGNDEEMKKAEAAIKKATE